MGKQRYTQRPFVCGVVHVPYVITLLSTPLEHPLNTPFLPFPCFAEEHSAKASSSAASQAARFTVGVAAALVAAALLA